MPDPRQPPTGAPPVRVGKTQVDRVGPSSGENDAMWDALYHLSNKGQSEVDPETEEFFVRRARGDASPYSDKEREIASRAFYRLSQNGKHQLPQRWAAQMRAILAK